MPVVKPNKYIARIYGFKIFGRKGSKYEGQIAQAEEKEQEKMIKKKKQEQKGTQKTRKKQRKYQENREKRKHK